MPNHSHRSGGLSQSNKKNKRTRASKRSINRAAGGRVNAKSAASNNLSIQSKADRRHRTQQRRQASRAANIQKRRGLSGGAPPPRIVGLISLAASTGDLEERVRSFALQTADKVVSASAGKATVTAKYDMHKKDGVLTFLTSSTAFSSGQDDDAAIMSALDLCRVCDVILFLIDGNGSNGEEEQLLGMQIGGDAASISTKKSQTTQEWDHLIASRADRILAAVKAQGLPTPITVLAKTAAEEPEDYMTMKSMKSVRRSALKRKQDLKKYISRFAETEFGVDNNKVLEVDLTTTNEEDDMDDDGDNTFHTNSSSSSSAALVRTLCTMAASPPKWVSQAQRPYIVSDSFSYNDSNENLTITGYIRGQLPWDVHSLLHIPSLGTFCCRGVQKAQAPFAHSAGETKALMSDPMKRDSLDMFALPDALEGEQNLVGFDETLEEEVDEEEDAVARPAGWSDYQSSWLDAMDDMSAGAGEFDHGELAKELNQKKSSSASTVGGMDVDDDDYDVSPEERRVLVEQRRKNHKEDTEFPDEVDVPEDINARDRFARYRSLTSFRKSHWDPKETLPDSYSSIYHFRSFKSTQREVRADLREVSEAANSTTGNFWGASPASMMNDMAEDDDEDQDILEGCVPSGSYVTLVVENVSSKAYTRIADHGIVCAVGLMPHENKVSVLHMGLCQSQGCDQAEDVAVKSKDILTFRCGWRTWKGRPVFSQNNLNSDKHKFERFLPQNGAFFAASAFGPVTYTPCPVLVFRERQDELREFVALGSILSADADRIVVKRVVLTGFPVRVHKRTATVKYMFYSPDDVRWFKPAGLSTKHGLNGHIVESVGEHGTMKCLFSAPIKQHDTVCLPLYKRIFPKFANSTPSSDDGATVKSVITKEALLIL